MAYDADAYVKEWEEKIDLGLKYKKKYSDLELWPTYRDMYRGNFGDKKVVVNRTFSYIKSMIPRIYFRSPNVCIAPRRPEFAAAARVLERVDNWLIQETGLKYTLRRAILEAGLTGIGPIKLGYDSEYGFLPELKVDQDTASVSQVGVKDGSRIEYNTNIQPGMPWGARVRADELVTPWGYSDPNDLPWIAHMIMRPVEDVRQDQKYDKKTRAEIKGGFGPSFRNAQASSLPPVNGINCEDFALLYEIRDLKRKEFIVICEGKLLQKTEDTLQIDGMPWEFVIFNEDPEHFWPISDVRMFKPQQDELNEIRQYAKVMRRHSILKFLYTKGTLTPENLQLVLSGDIEDIAAGIEVTTDAIQSAVYPFQPHNTTADYLREQQQTEMDMRSTMGFSENQAGSYVDKTNSTATEATLVQEGANIRSDERRDIVADVMVNIIRKWNQFIFRYWTTPRVTEITGLDGQRYWIQYTGEQLRGEYNFVISPESGQPVTRQLRQQLAQQMFQYFNGDPLIDQVGLRQLVLQQTDLIDPSWQNLIRPPAIQPGMPGSGPSTPMPFEQAAETPGVLQGGPNPQGA